MSPKHGVARRQRHEDRNAFSSSPRTTPLDLAGLPVGVEVVLATTGRNFHVGPVMRAAHDHRVGDEGGHPSDDLADVCEAMTLLNFSFSHGPKAVTPTNTGLGRKEAWATAWYKGPPESPLLVEPCRAGNEEHRNQSRSFILVSLACFVQTDEAAKGIPVQSKAREILLFSVLPNPQAVHFAPAFNDAR
eukprot:CAMPEP_0170263104 /NCGR_PEP_ID=MMETSP0116_2-20130129/31436_1 /TAXON_ID=400756 /ORGANISM="Durinskia baltica, Strain CSIRO CS-38" /LENGTH=188 /DNA_ID=CAMNT_0010514175 /DNA_START=57 /DNA_END=624 /DNA_ORIENTATION=-